MAYYDDVKTTKIAYIGFVSVMGTLLIVMLLQVLYFQTRDRPDGCRSKPMPARRPS